jgi:hypothetical protein
MKTRTALLAAIACGAAAVVLVGADVAFNVDALLEVRAADGSWKTAAELGGSPRAYPSVAFCGSHFRLTVTNHLLWATTTDVTITASGPGPQKLLLDEAWHLGAGESKVHEFQVPSGTFDTQPARSDGVPVKGSGSVEVLLGHDYGRQLYAQACEESTA